MVTMRKVLAKNTNIGRSDKRNTNYLYSLDYIRNNVNLLTVDVSSNIRMEYPADFYGLLVHHNVSPRLHYVTMLLNGYNSSNEYNGVGNTLTIIDETDGNIRLLLKKMSTIS